MPSCTEDGRGRVEQGGEGDSEVAIVLTYFCKLGRRVQRRFRVVVFAVNVDVEEGCSESRLKFPVAD